VILAGYKKVSPHRTQQSIFYYVNSVEYNFIGIRYVWSIHVFKLGRSMPMNSPRLAKFNELALVYRHCLIKCIKVNKV
jgi:hypothetical protein